MHPQEYFEIISERKQTFKTKWEEKSLLEWNLAEYIAYRKLFKESE
jgi:hypothetical protein